MIFIMSESIQSIDFGQTSNSPTLSIHIRLAANIPACCGVADGAYMEFHREGHYARAELTLREDRAGNVLDGAVILPEPGVYGYRLVAKILGKMVYLEGTLDPDQK